MFGPIEIMPGIFLGNEDNARDHETLARLGIKSILNVAKEVNGIEDVAAAHDLRFLKLDWSHGQKNLLKEGFPNAFAFVDESRASGYGVLIQ
jgi:tyrosine-protein phosphatase